LGKMIKPLDQRIVVAVERGAEVEGAVGTAQVLGEILAGGERAPFAGEDDAAHGRIALRRVERDAQLGMHRRSDRVELVAPRQGDDENPLPARGADRLWHGSPPVHACALGRADTCACQRCRLTRPSGISIFAGLMKSTDTSPVISATVKWSL